MFSRSLSLILSIVVGNFLTIFPAYGQTSLIDEILKLEPAIVSVKSINTDIFTTPARAAARDPRTGRIVVLRKLRTAHYDRFGAGVIIDPSGIIVTNAHIVNLAEHLTVILHNKKEIPAQVLFVVKDSDIAFLKIELSSPIEAVELADSDQIKLRDQVITVGNSFLLRQTVSGGQVIGLGQTKQQMFRGPIKTNELIHTDINLYEGDSGGPLFDHRGRLIGLMTAKEVQADHSSFALPSNHIKRFWAEYVHGQKK